MPFLPSAPSLNSDEIVAALTALGRPRAVIQLWTRDERLAALIQRESRAPLIEVVTADGRHSWVLVRDEVD